ncbi:NYN domain protein [Burkholderia ubonensis]|uniref:NYN domain-containing protein n=1 Tax=Burkholderia ubonensis TaxID=101571 RepID=UPI00075296CB|nr:NYN domain-containing protein [Burkholderia ubonensis]KWA83131.1 NYN domain protein [Burkholderia ubonensis]KWB35167.1 NYN domain protein [Burkholderia ubonensis]
MALPLDNVSMAVFCDFENVALGVRDAKYEKFDIKPVLERLLLKGSIVVKKAYCDWDRYKGFKASMHEASFELIEIPHVRQSGKNSADIRLVVDALDLCYTKSHVDTFVIISGDSDFSPLVSKLRENAKKVIGVGVKQSTSDLLVANCDEFIFYDDLVREQQRALAKREQQRAGNGGAKRPDEPSRKPELEARRTEAIALAVETFDALASERDDVGKIWASVLKSAIKRRKPDFNESYYGFRAFGNLLDEAQARGLLEVGRDDKSGAFVSRARQAAAAEPAAPVDAPAAQDDARAAEPARAERERRHGRHGAAHAQEAAAPAVAEAVERDVADAAAPEAAGHADAAGPAGPGEAHDEKKDGRKRARKSAAKKAGTKKGDAKKADAKPADAKPADARHGDEQHGDAKHADTKHGDGKHAERIHADAPQVEMNFVDSAHADATSAGTKAADVAVVEQPQPEAAAPAEAAADATPKKPARKTAPRARRPRKTTPAAE